MIKRNRYMVYFLIISVIAATILILKPASAEVMRQSKGVIVLDAGHGGFDAGASGRITKVREDILNLSVAKKLQRLFEINGYTVVMTREDDNAIASTKKGDMARREQIIEDTDPDIVISIHMNKFADASVAGPMAFYYEKSEEGKMLAELIQQQLNEYLQPPKPRTFKPEDYFMLRNGDCPCVLVECGFLSNEREEELLQTDEYQEKCAKAIYKGAAAFFSQLSGTNEELPQVIQ
jgi:N-acetylmuramoyl-L-alanine amidase